MNTVRLEMTSDFICPWCFVAERRIARLREKAGTSRELAITFAPFELNPDMPVEGLDRRIYRTRKFGSWDRSLAMDAHVTAVGRADGIDFHFERIKVTPNTRRAHRLVWWAEQRGSAERLVDAIFTAYFTEGRDIGSKPVLAEIAASVGLPGEETARMLDGTDGEEEVSRLEAEAHDDGTHAVPRMRVGDRVFEGAVPFGELLDVTAVTEPTQRRVHG